MRVAVRLSGGLAARAGRPFLVLELPDGVTARALRQELERRFPELGDLLTGALAVAAGRVLGPDDPVDGGEEVALLLPVAGGGST